MYFLSYSIRMSFVMLKLINPFRFCQPNSYIIKFPFIFSLKILASIANCTPIQCIIRYCKNICIERARIKCLIFCLLQIFRIINWCPSNLQLWLESCFLFVFRFPLVLWIYGFLPSTYFDQWKSLRVDSLALGTNSVVCDSLFP